MTDRQQQGFVDLGDQRLDYRWIAPRGDGLPTLVFLHEGLGCIGIWKSFPDLIAEATGCGALIYSRAGYGNSSPIPLPRPLHYLHDEGLTVLPRLLDMLDLRDVILIGHSDGASISLIHAGSGEAARILGVVAEAPHVFNEEMCIIGIEKAKTAYVEGDLRPKLQRLHGDNVDCAFWGWNGTWLDPGFREWNIEEFLPRITVPVLVIQGRGDEYGSSAQYEAIHAQCGGPVEVMVLDACGHSPHREQPEATAQAIIRFIAAQARQTLTA